MKHLREHFSVLRAAAAAFALMLTLIAGCATGEATQGTYISDDKVHQIQVGTTSEIDVVTLLGEPDKRTELGSHILYTYTFTKTKSSGAYVPYYSHTENNSTTDRLTITFDKASEKVTAFSMQRGSVDANKEAPK